MRFERWVGPRGIVLRAAVTQTRHERMRGLLDRSSLGPNEALLLVRARSIHTFGMRFPIAVALLDRTLVVRSVRCVPPGRLVLPRPGVRHVLELAETSDLRPGDRLRLVGPPIGRMGRPPAAILPVAAPGPGAGAAGRARAPIV